MLVEGQTEERFVKVLIEPHLLSLGIYATCTLIATRRVEGRREYRGETGGTYRHIKRDLHLLLGSNPACVTTLVDLHRFPTDLPGYPEAAPIGASEHARVIGELIVRDMGDERLLPGILVHEFEALLFSDTDSIARIAGGRDHTRIASQLKDVAHQFASPEEIDGEDPPSLRLESVIPGYKKLLHGPAIAKDIGLEKIRSRCPVFDSWLSRLEALARTGPEILRRGGAPPHP